MLPKQHYPRIQPTTTNNKDSTTVGTSLLFPEKATSSRRFSLRLALLFRKLDDCVQQLLLEWKQHLLRMLAYFLQLSLQTTL